ncbi:unnamed protein product [Nesidiocoris tenuis]|uniref:Uncharacterized protein n=1 Tax=Nesidiocoris tenuis TaxID=355587 RepID=A0A6H5HFS7_9HEMI|nr:unnamed protein product [Nesidiocoris tenuis]
MYRLVFGDVAKWKKIQPDEGGKVGYSFNNLLMTLTSGVVKFLSRISIWEPCRVSDNRMIVHHQPKALTGVESAPVLLPASDPANASKSRMNTNHDDIVVARSDLSDRFSAKPFSHVFGQESTRVLGGWCGVEH